MKKLASLHKERLEKLAAHLEKGKLGHEKFTFALINSGPRDKRGLGRSGCALGELPFAFPGQYVFTSEGVLRRVGVKYPDYFSRCLAYADKFFDLNCEAYYWLFIPESLPRPWAKNKTLGKNATRRHVAANIRQYIRWREREASKPLTTS